jgi:hypothetical protein
MNQFAEDASTVAAAAGEQQQGRQAPPAAAKELAPAARPPPLAPAMDLLSLDDPVPVVPAVPAAARGSWDPFSIPPAAPVELAAPQNSAAAAWNAFDANTVPEASAPAPLPVVMPLSAPARAIDPFALPGPSPAQFASNSGPVGFFSIQSFPTAAAAAVPFSAQSFPTAAAAAVPLPAPKPQMWAASATMPSSTPLQSHMPMAMQPQVQGLGAPMAAAAGAPSLHGRTVSIASANTSAASGHRTTLSNEDIMKLFDQPQPLRSVPAAVAAATPAGVPYEMQPGLNRF